MKNQGFIALVLLCLAATGCYKDQDNTGAPVTIIETPDIKISTTVYGVVVDENGEEIDNYNISVNENSVAVDQDVFKLDLNNVNKRNQHISVIKEGQEIAFANVSLIENDYNKLEIKALPKWEESNNIASSTPLISNNQYSVQLANDQLNELVEFGVIEDEATLQQMGLWARGVDTENYFLNPVSGFYYQNHQENNSIAISYFQNNQEEIGLFHLDNNFHQWVLVNKLSPGQTINTDSDGYYMLANYSTATFIEGKVTFTQLPVSYQKITLESSFNQDINILSSAKGRWSAFVPDETILKVIMYSPCQDIIAEGKEIMSQNQEIHLSELTSSISTNFLPVNFRNVDCEGNIISVPGIHIDYGTIKDHFIFGEENIVSTISVCGDINIGGFDVENNMTGPSIFWNENIEDELGVLSTCTAANNGYSYLKINNEIELLPTFALSENDGNIILSAPDNTIRIKIKGTEIGAYPEEQVNIFIEDEDFGKDGYLIRCENSTAGCGIDDCYISHLENMNNGLSRISFSGTLWMQTINNPTAGNYPIEGEIVIKQ